MIVVDTNVILRYLVGSRTPSDDPLCAAAEALFDRVDRGSEQVVTYDAVVAEVVFILHGPRHYGLQRSDVADRLRALFAHPGVGIAGKPALLDGLAWWAGTPSLSFVDALTIARARADGHGLAAFDAAMARHVGVPVWRSDEA